MKKQNKKANKKLKKLRKIKSQAAEIRIKKHDSEQPKSILFSTLFILEEN